MIVLDQGRYIILNSFVDSAPFITAVPYSNDYTPVAASTTSDFTSALIDPGVYRLGFSYLGVVGTAVVYQSGLVTFAGGWASPLPRTLYGVYISRSGVVIAAERLETPVTVSTVNQTAFTRQFTLKLSNS